MGVILEMAPTVMISGGSNVDLTEVHQKIEANKQAIGDLTALATDHKDSLAEAVNEVHSDLDKKADLARVETIEKYLISLEERLSRVDIEIMDPKSILFID